MRMSKRERAKKPSIDHDAKEPKFASIIKRTLKDNNNIIISSNVA